MPQMEFVRGDARVYSIAAASVVAKVHRDRLMTELEHAHPGYGFAGHAGYATAEHREAIRRLGPCPGAPPIVHPSLRAGGCGCFGRRRVGYPRRAGGDLSVDVVMPKLSDTMEEGKILRWLKKPGDQVAVGDVLAEVETDKADMELEAEAAGVLGKILVEEGGSAAVGDAIAQLTDDDSKPAAAKSEKHAAATAPTAPKSVTRPPTPERRGPRPIVPPRPQPARPLGPRPAAGTDGADRSARLRRLPRPHAQRLPRPAGVKSSRRSAVRSPAA